MTAFLDTFAIIVAAIVILGALMALGIAARIFWGRRAAARELAELSKLVDEMGVTDIPDFSPPRPARPVAPVVLIAEDVDIADDETRDRSGGRVARE